MKVTDSIFRVIDTETTHIDPLRAKVCEIGLCDVFKNSDTLWERSRGYASLCNPGEPIPPEAKAVHHILDHDVRDRAPAKTIIDEIALPHSQPERLVFVAHNAAYDRPVLEAAGFPTGRRWLCTWRLALHVWSRAPSYKNEVLRYWLGYDSLPWETPGGPPAQTHRAGHDVQVTALILGHALSELEERIAANDDVDKLIAWAESPVLLIGPMGFGKHEAKTWEECAAADPGYFAWMMRQNEADWDRDKWHTAKHYHRVSRGLT